METSFETRNTERRTADIRVGNTARCRVLEPEVQMTVLEHAFRALRADPPGLTSQQFKTHCRLRRQLLDAAVSQFVGKCNGLARRSAAGGTLLLTEESYPGGGWRITRFDAATQPDGHDHYDDEREAIRQLLMRAA